VTAEKRVAPRSTEGTFYLFAKPGRLGSATLSRKKVEIGFMFRGSEPGCRARPWGFGDPIIAEMPGNFEDEGRLLDDLGDLHLGETELRYRWHPRVFAAFGIREPSRRFMKRLGAERMKAREAARKAKKAAKR
jgi:hypothetical protein